MEVHAPVDNVCHVCRVPSSQLLGKLLACGHVDCVHHMNLVKVDIHPHLLLDYKPAV